MDQAPFFSIIIPIYNAEEYIIETLQSIESQILKEFEVIIVDDGSIDQSVDIVLKYISDCKYKVNFIRQTNQGVSAARNTGIQSSEGKYIVFLDSDDLLHPFFLSVFYKYLKDNSLIFCAFTRDWRKFNRFQISDFEHSQLLNSTELYRSFLFQFRKCGFTTFVYERETLMGQNIFFTEGTRYAEDIEFICKYLTFFKKGTYIDIPLYFYRENPKSAMNVGNKYMEQSLQVMTRIETFLQVNKVDFYYEFKKYMFSRELLSLLHKYAYLNMKDYYKELCEDYDIKNRMRFLLKYPSLKIKLSAIFIIFSPNLFFYIVRWSKI